MAIYDIIHTEYNKYRYDIKRIVSSDYTFLRHIGDVRGKSLMDLGCGDGNHLRALKKAGSAEAVGIDISEKMLDFARAEETRSPAGIKYECHDAAKLHKVGRFDIVLGSFLLHYSRTRDDLFGMCRNAAANTRNDGMFVGLNLDPVDPMQPDKRYGSTITCEGPLLEGCTIKVVIYDGEKPICEFQNYHWSKATYENALRTAGFGDIEWHGMEVSCDGMARFGEQFWDNYIKRSGLVVFKCWKRPKKL